MSNVQANKIFTGQRADNNGEKNEIHFNMFKYFSPTNFQ